MPTNTSFDQPIPVTTKREVLFPSTALAVTYVQKPDCRRACAASPSSSCMYGERAMTSGCADSNTAWHLNSEMTRAPHWEHTHIVSEWIQVTERHESDSIDYEICEKRVYTERRHNTCQ